jgi:peptidoglycan/xylan/chitin deacetylase (PgdA/CDA1 family)
MLENMDLNLRLHLLSATVKLLTSPPFDTIGRKYAGEIVPIFMLHRFRHPELSPYHGHRPDFVRKALQYLRANRFRILELDEVVETALRGEPLPAQSVVFTMDDGFVDQAEVGAPIFIEYEAPLTCFLNSGMLDQQLWPWDDRVYYAFRNAAKASLSMRCAEHNWHFDWHADSRKMLRIMEKVRDDLKTINADQLEIHLQQLFAMLEVEVPVQAPAGYKPMSWQQARALEARGVRFSAHTVTHRIISRLSDTEANNEIVQSRDRLRNELTNPGAIFCYPTGRAQDFSERDQQLVRASGYRGAVSTEPGYLEPMMDGEGAYSIRRFAMPYTMPEFIQYCTWIEKAKLRLRQRYSQASNVSNSGVFR